MATLVHPPVPKYDGYNDGFNFHYCKPDEVKQGQFTEKHHLKKEKVQCDVKDRELNDYCPRVQLRKLFESCSLPKFHLKEPFTKMAVKPMFQLMLMEQKRRFSARLMNSSKNIRVKIYATLSCQMSIIIFQML